MRVHTHTHTHTESTLTVCINETLSHIAKYSKCPGYNHKFSKYNKTGKAIFLEKDIPGGHGYWNYLYALCIL